MNSLLNSCIADLEQIQNYQLNAVLQKKSGINLLIPLFVK
nr:MAG TPA: hypothetical protein [Caudoviricetes sp.]